ncbi:B4GALNT2 [Branchiostoma lanceolatum]|uniref:B4GALNT2 protein n=1 Tax=Branchiostoma lanceolatum TaxID=7740 RepID=A0A8J9Z1N9_BRALA|nr:B4GALNT2 [Branchiostoma lanceolatum]
MDGQAFFVKFVVFFCGSFCGHILTLHFPTTYKNYKERFDESSGYDIEAVFRPLEQKQDYPIQLYPIATNDLKEMPCSMCYGHKLKLSSAEKNQREASLKRHERRRLDLLDVELKVDGSSPLSYPAHGFHVKPMRAVWLKGLRVEWFSLDDLRSNLMLKMSADRGIFKLVGLAHGVVVTGNSTNIITLSTRTPSLLNYQLKYIIYKNTIFDTNIVDQVLIRYKTFSATLPIHIHHIQLPWLFKYKTGQVKDRVTVIVKTFLRYSRLKDAIQSVDNVHPGTRIVVADDTPDSLFTNFQSSNVDHFRMPAYQGYFAGRNLGLSQVYTEYFFYIDDDMEITKNTKLELLLSFLDKTNFHLVSVDAGHPALSSIFIPLGNKTHRCFVQKPYPGYYHEIADMPGFFVNDAPVNAFLGSTNEVKAVGFDPHPTLSRKAHEEFFLSALGRLRIATCGHCSVRHMKKKGSESGNYKTYRYGDTISKNRTHYNLYMHNIECQSINWGIPRKMRMSNRLKAKDV